MFSWGYKVIVEIRDFKLSASDKKAPKILVLAMAATEVYHGSHVAWQEQYILFRMGKMFFLMQNIFIVPAVQYGCRAKTPLYVRRSKLVIRPKPATEEQVSSWKIIVRSYAFSTK